MCEVFQRDHPEHPVEMSREVADRAPEAHQLVHRLGRDGARLGDPCREVEGLLDSPDSCRDGSSARVRERERVRESDTSREREMAASESKREGCKETYRERGQ